MLPGAINPSINHKNGMPDAQLGIALGRAANPIIIINRASNVVWCNKAYCQMVNATENLVLNTKPFCLQPTKDNTKFLSDVWSILLSGNSWRGELTENRRITDLSAANTSTALNQSASHAAASAITNVLMNPANTITPPTPIIGGILHLDAVISPLDDARGHPTLFMLFLHDVTDRKNKYDQMWKMANHDRLTGLANRGFFLSMLDHTIADNERTNGQFALLYIDLDGFKYANDTHGHDMGDAILVKVAETLKLSVRRSDFVARIGGDEFVCILNRITTFSDATDVASKIISSVSALKQINNTAVSIGASIGISTYPEDGTIDTDLIKAADTAMYLAKRDGKNCWRHNLKK